MCMAPRIRDSPTWGSLRKITTGSPKGAGRVKDMIMEQVGVILRVKDMFRDLAEEVVEVVGTTNINNTTIKVNMVLRAMKIRHLKATGSSPIMRVTVQLFLLHNLNLLRVTPQHFKCKVQKINPSHPRNQNGLGTRRGKL